MSGIIASTSSSGYVSPAAAARRSSARAAGPLSTAVGRAFHSRKSPERTRRLVALSSTTSTEGPANSPGSATGSWSRPTGLAEMAVEMERAALARLALDGDLAPHEGARSATKSSVPGRSRRSGASSSRRPGRTARRSAAAFRPGCRCPCRRRQSPGRSRRPIGSATSGADDDFAAFGELDRVADQVDEDLPQAARVADDARRERRRRCRRPARALAVGAQAPAS